MNREIENYLATNTFDRYTRWGVVNEGKALLAELKKRDESELLCDIDTYEFFAANGEVNFRKKETRTYLNEGMFSFFYRYGDHYISTVYDSDGKPCGSYAFTENTVHKPEIFFGNGTAHGTVHVFTDAKPAIRDLELKFAEDEILDKCREHFGQW